MFYGKMLKPSSFELDILVIFEENKKKNHVKKIIRFFFYMMKISGSWRKT